MINLKVTPLDAVLVAIDVSKLRNDVLIEMTGVSQRRPLVVLNTRPEHDRFIDGLLDQPQSTQQKSIL